MSARAGHAHAWRVCAGRRLERDEVHRPHEAYVVAAATVAARLWRRHATDKRRYNGTDTVLSADTVLYMTYICTVHSSQYRLQVQRTRYRGQRANKCISLI